MQLPEELLDLLKQDNNQQPKYHLPEPPAIVYDQQMMQPQQQQAGKYLLLGEVLNSLAEIYNYYSRIYVQLREQFNSFGETESQKFCLQHFLLFCGDFKLIKDIFSRNRLISLYKKHANYTKHMSMQDFQTFIASLALQTQARLYFNGLHNGKGTKSNEDLQQQFYLYLKLDGGYKEQFRQIFRPFGCKQQPQSQKIKYNYRKFSLPQLRKKAIPAYPVAKKVEKQVFISKSSQKPTHKQFDQATSIVVSWDSLRAKSVAHLPSHQQIIQKRYLKGRQISDPYLQGLRPDSRNSPKQDARSNRARQIELKIKEIEVKEQAKNQLLLKRIEKKMEKKLQMPQRRPFM